MTATVAGVRATLTGAVRVLAQVGWTQHMPFDQAGRVCARRAIQIAADDPDAAVDALHEVGQFLRPLGLDLVQWNDQYGRRPEHATALLRTVASRVAA